MQEWYVYAEAEHVRKAREVPEVKREALEWLKRLVGGALQSGSLEQTVEALYADSYAVGVHSASTVAGVSDPTRHADWPSWAPGNPVAAALVSQSPGLQGLLDQAGVVIQGINDTTLERLATQLADGLERGLPARDVAAAMNAVLDDTDRSHLIALTETTRAVNTATLDTYRIHDIGSRRLLTAADPCNLCQQNADMGCVPLDNDLPNGDAPVHPRCRCVSLPCT